MVRRSNTQCADGLTDPGETPRPKDSWFGIPHGPSISKNIFLKSPPMASHIIKKIKTVQHSKAKKNFEKKKFFFSLIKNVALDTFSEGKFFFVNEKKNLKKFFY